MRKWYRLPLYLQIFVGIIIGVALGIFLGPRVTLIKPVGDIFIRLLMMLIVPLTFFTLISGITKLESLKSLRSMGGMLIIYYAASSLISAAVGVAAALIFRPGKEAIGILDAGIKVEPANFNFLDNLVSWIPKNPIEALSSGNMLQIIVFSLFVGIGLLAMKHKAKGLIKIIDDGADLMIIITGFVMKTAPYGILALVANMTADLGGRMLKEVGRFILTDYIALAVILIIIYPIILKTLGRVSPIRFYRNIAPAMLVAAGTTSSGATLPVSMAVAEKNMGASEKIWGFALPLGATINMNGMAAAIGVISVFAANLYGVAITPALLFQFVFLGLALSMGTAGVKGAGVIMSGILLQSLNMPLTLIPILASLWPVLDIGHTACNVTGDLVGTAVIGSRLGLMDIIKFNGRNYYQTKPKL